MKKTLFYIFGTAIVSALVAACGSSQSKSGRTDTYSSGAITFASDESFSPIIEQEMDVFHSIYTDAHVTPIYTDDSTATRMLLDDSVQLIITARQFSKEEKDYFITREFIPKEVLLAYDGLALLVNKSNNDTLITVNDLRRILLGEVTKWSDIYPGSKRGDIQVVFDNRNSSTVRYASDSILGGNTIESPNVTATQKTADVIDFVEKNPNAIGIIGSNWLNDKGDTTNLTFNKEIKVMSVSRQETATVDNSWKPYQYYLYNGNYPLVRSIYALLNDPRNGLPWGFAQFIASPKGQKILLRAGLLPAYGNITIRDMNVKY